MKKLLLVGVALSALVAGPAMAADLPVRAPIAYKSAPVITYYSWTGCYIGGNVGGVWIKKDETLATPFGTSHARAPRSVPRRRQRHRGRAGRL